MTGDLLPPLPRFGEPGAAPGQIANAPAASDVSGSGACANTRSAKAARITSVFIGLHTTLPVVPMAGVAQVHTDGHLRLALLPRASVARPAYDEVLSVETSWS